MTTALKSKLLKKFKVIIDTRCALENTYDRIKMLNQMMVFTEYCKKIKADESLVDYLNAMIYHAVSNNYLWMDYSVKDILNILQSKR